MAQAKHILYCNCSKAGVIPAEVKREVLRRLGAAEVGFDAVADLCELAARRDPIVKRLAESSELRVAACFPRTVRCLFDAADTPLPDENVELLNMREQSAEVVVGRLLAEGPLQPELSIVNPADRLKSLSQSRPEPRALARAEQRNVGFGRGSKPRIVLYEGPGSTPLHDELRLTVLGNLLDDGFDVTRLRMGDALPPTDSSTLLVVGRFDERQPLQTSGARGGAPPRFLDLSGLGPGGLLTEVRRLVTEAGAAEPSTWKAWFPVIDRERCTKCRQCLSFCLFDVFGVDETEQVWVQAPENCKTNCPACARVCPNVAIIFPKYDKGPINGDIVRDADIPREPIKVDMSALLAGSVHASLRARSRGARKRFCTTRDDSEALELCDCSRRMLQAHLGIPDEVLANLAAASETEEPTDRPGVRPAGHQAHSPIIEDEPPPPSADEWGV